MKNGLDDTRIQWVDYAKGICIVLVVMMHTTLGVEKAAGAVSWLHGFITWAKPFRMPDFFLISGLFLSSRIYRPWRDYFDSKILHFVYFYVLWLTLQCLFKAWPIYVSGGMNAVFHDYVMGFIEPFGTLWFIYMLALFFLVVRLTRNLPPLLMFVIGAVLEIAPVETGNLLIDEFASRFVFFYGGFWLAPYVFGLASRVNAMGVSAIFSGLLVWVYFNSYMVNHNYAEMPWVSLPMGFIGAGAVISTGVLMSKFDFAKPLRYIGENSIVIYLSFFLFMAATRTVLLHMNLLPDLGMVAIVTTAAGVIGPLLLYWLVRDTTFSFLFRRPNWARLASRPTQWHSAPYVRLKPPKTRRPSLSR
jgi:uncharacterized membrane protein YcfT